MINELSIVKAAKVDIEQEHSTCGRQINEKYIEIKKLLEELNDIKINIDRISNERMRFISETDRLKSHVMTLTEQNQKVILFY